VMKKSARLRPYLVHCPIKVLHPALLVTQYPVVQIYQLFRDVVRFLDGLDDPDRDRSRLQKSLRTDNKGLRGRAMPAAGVRGNDQNFWGVGLHLGNLDLQLLANFHNRIIGDLIVSRYGCSFFSFGVLPNRVTATLSQQSTTIKF